MRLLRSVVVGCVLSTQASNALAQLVVPGAPGMPTAAPPPAVPPPPAPAPSAPATPPIAPPPTPSATVAPAPAPWHAPPPTSPGLQMPPDIVRLKNGGFVRGVILELDPNVRTVIQAEAGRREIAASEIVYAGPATRDPLAAPVAPSPTPNPPPAAPLRLVPDVPLVELRSTTPSVQFFLWTGSDTYKGGGSDDLAPWRTWSSSGSGETFRPLCMAPCSVPLPEGYYRMGVARRGERPVLLEGNVRVRRGVPLQAEYTTDTRSRAGPVGIIVGSTALLVAGIVVGLRASQSEESGDVLLPLVLGTAGFAGLITGIVLLRREPDTVRIRSLLPGAASARQAMAPRSAEAPRMLGPTFTGSF